MSSSGQCIIVVLYNPGAPSESVVGKDGTTEGRGLAHNFPSGPQKNFLRARHPSLGIERFASSHRTESPHHQSYLVLGP
jgi:hypothetical protein